MLEALKALSTFFGENSLRTRRNLRGDIERRSLAINEEFLQTFQGVKNVCKLPCILLKLLLFHDFIVNHNMRVLFHEVVQ